MFDKNKVFNFKIIFLKCLKINSLNKEVKKNNLKNLMMEELEYNMKGMKSKKKMKIAQITKSNLKKKLFPKKEVALFIREV
jgi:hypothetical protein